MSYKRNSRQVPMWSLNGGNYPDAPEEPSRWDQFLTAEGLEEKDLKKNDPKVMDFVMKHHQKYYAPTKVLKMYKVDYADA